MGNRNILLKQVSTELQVATCTLFEC